MVLRFCNASYDILIQPLMLNGGHIRVPFDTTGLKLERVGASQKQS